MRTISEKGYGRSAGGNVAECECTGGIRVQPECRVDGSLSNAKDNVDFTSKLC